VCKLFVIRNFRQVIVKGKNARIFFAKCPDYEDKLPVLGVEPVQRNEVGDKKTVNELVE
jgi:hypothetical protein